MAKTPSRKKAKEASQQHSVSAVFLADNVDSMSRGLVDPSTITYSEKLVKAIRDLPIYSVSHKTDMDGVSSSALLHKFYSVPAERIKFMEYSNASYNEVAEWLTGKGITNSVVVFTDVGINPDAFKLFQSTLLTLKQKGNMVVWLDHHPWGPEQVNFCAENVSYLVAGENRLMCGADLTYNVLCFPTPKVLALERSSSMLTFSSSTYFLALFTIRRLPKSSSATIGTMRLRRLSAFFPDQSM